MYYSFYPEGVVNKHDESFDDIRSLPWYRENFREVCIGKNTYIALHQYAFGLYFPINQVYPYIYGEFYVFGDDKAKEFPKSKEFCNEVLRKFHKKYVKYDANIFYQY